MNIYIGEDTGWVYTHKVICSSTVRKLVKFCQTWFFFLNVMPGALLTFTPGFPAGFLTPCSTDAGLALEELLLYMVSPGQVGSPSGLTFRTSIVFLGRFGYGVLGSPSRDSCRAVWPQVGSEGRRGLRDPISLPGLEPGAWRCLGSVGCPHWGLVLPSPVTCLRLIPRPLGVSQFSHTSSRELMSRPGCRRVARKCRETRQPHGCPESWVRALWFTDSPPCPSRPALL